MFGHLKERKINLDILQRPFQNWFQYRPSLIKKTFQPIYNFLYKGRCLMWSLWERKTLITLTEW